MNQTLDIEAVLATFIIFSIISIALLLPAGSGFHNDLSLSFKFSSENMAPLTYDFLGFFSLFTAAAVNYFTRSPPNTESRLIRVLCIHPLNAAMTTGTAGAAVILSWAIGFFVFTSNFSLGLLCILVSIFVLLTVIGLARLGDILINHKLDSIERVLIGGGLFFSIVIYSMVLLVQYITSQL